MLSPRALEELADRCLRSRQPVWTGFLPPQAWEEALQRLAGREDLRLRAEGGHPRAERRRLGFSLGHVGDGSEDRPDPAPPLGLLDLTGDFLFDPASTGTVTAALGQLGAGAEGLGDVLLRGDRGGLLIVTPELQERLDGQTLQVGSVAARLAAAPWERLNPQPLQERIVTTVEASLRLDAVASAGFGLSRSRLADLIRQGRVRIDWHPVTSPSRELRLGQRVQLEGRGELELLAADLTRRDRWRLQLRRRS